MKEVIIKASGAQTTSTTGDGIQVTNENFEQRFTQALFVLDITALATEVGDTLDVMVDVSPDGETWFNAVHFTQAVGNGSAATEVAKLNEGLFNDPDAVLAVTSDASAGVTRNLGVMPYVRYRSTINDAVTTSNVSFTYSLKAYFY